MINYDFTYNELLYFLLIFVRVASFVFVAPFFSMGNTPARIRAGLSFFYYPASVSHSAGNGDRL